MTDQSLADTIMKEVSNLPLARQADVLTFVRFLKIGLANTEIAENQFEAALIEVRKIAKDREITEQDIADEIQAVRDQT